MFDRANFRNYFTNEIGAAANTMNTYNSFLNRIDQAIGGLDEAIDRDGVESVAAWAQQSEQEPFLTYRSHARSVLKRYLQFRIERASSPLADDGDEDLELDEVLQSDANFKVEKEMQAQVRLQISQVEPGLLVDDGGVETSVATGKIDIVARDSEGKLVASS